MNVPKLTLGISAHPHVLALCDGRVSPKGFALEPIVASPPEIFWRMIKEDEFDISEMSLSAYIMMRARGEKHFCGIPVFPSRVFRHSFIYVRTDSDIREPQDLKGKRIGVPEYHMTAALFIRGLLSDDYGVHAEDIQWFQGGQETAGRIERMRLDLPDAVTVTHVPDRSLLDLVQAGELDGLISAEAPSEVYQGEPVRLRRLFDRPQEVEQDWFNRTGIMPIMHTVVIKQDVLDAHPQVAEELVRCFTQAKEIYYRDLDHELDGVTPIPWLYGHIDFVRATFGDDFAPYGIEKNRQVLGAATRYSHEQGLSDHEVDLESLFPVAAAREPVSGTVG